MKIRLLTAATMCAAIALGTPLPGSAAANLTQQINLTATVTNVCQIASSAANVAFSTFDPVVANSVAGTGDDKVTYTASFTCTKGDAAFTIAFVDASGGSTTTCALKNGSNTLSYTISDGTNTNYCSGTANTPPSLVGTGLTALTQLYTFDLYGAQPSVPAGSYTDTKYATITP